MKKEKKAIVKNSNYYYKKACDSKILKRVLGCGCLVLLGLGTSLPFALVDNSKKELKIKQKSGYIEFIENSKTSLKEKHESGEISQNAYEAYISDLNNETLEGYLKKTDNTYYLAQYNENNDDIHKKTIIIGSSALGLILVMGTVELARTCVNLNKARELKEKEESHPTAFEL